MRWRIWLPLSASLLLAGALVLSACGDPPDVDETDAGSSDFIVTRLNRASDETCVTYRLTSGRHPTICHRNDDSRYLFCYPRVGDPLPACWRK
jgi:hypothetical protein